jgi:ABC-type antimicrobial peptide transport system permease subunit
MTRERLGELALLRALGLSGRQLVGWLSVENCFLLALGLISGAALGIIIALLVLPYSTLTSAGRAVVPRPVVVVPVEALVAIAGLGVFALVISVLVGRREVRRSSIVDVLRARED